MVGTSIHHDTITGTSPHGINNKEAEEIKDLEHRNEELLSKQMQSIVL